MTFSSSDINIHSRKGVSGLRLFYRLNGVQANGNSSFTISCISCSLDAKLSFIALSAVLAWSGFAKVMLVHLARNLASVVWANCLGIMG